jgi:serine acetyltransferase
MLSELKADLARYPGNRLGRLICALRSPAFYPIAVYRFGHEVYFRWPAKLAIAGKIPYKLAAFATEWATGIAIAPDASIGPGLYIGHWGTTRIGSQRLSCVLQPR